MLPPETFLAGDLSDLDNRLLNLQEMITCIDCVNLPKRCKACKVAGVRDWQKRNPEKTKETKRRWAAKNRPALKRIATEKKYKVSTEELEAIWERQGKACAICRRTSPGKKRFAIDHDHLTGVVRGLLCMNCNVGLGHFADSIERLEEAARYLARDNSAHPRCPLVYRHRKSIDKDLGWRSN